MAEQKQQALELTGALVDIVGEAWLLGPMVVPEDQKPVPVDRSFRLCFHVYSRDSQNTIRISLSVYAKNSGIILS